MPLNLPGVERSAFADMGWIPLERASIIMDGVRLPVRYRLGEEGKGFYQLMGTFDDYRVLMTLMALGAAQASMKEAISYAKQRTAFGQQIAKFEGVSFKIAEAATEIDRRVWEVMGKIEARKIKKMFDITGDDIPSMMKALSLSGWALDLEDKEIIIEKDKAILRT